MDALKARIDVAPEALLCSTLKALCEDFEFRRDVKRWFDKFEEAEKDLAWTSRKRKAKDPIMICWQC